VNGPETALSPARIRAARGLAFAADLLQIVVFPAFMEGFLSPANTVLDVVVGIAMTLLVGWHWSFVPSFISELVPVWDLVPTWTASVWLATRQSSSEAPIDVTPAAPAPPRLPPSHSR
jgi:hypothetical protein